MQSLKEWLSRTGFEARVNVLTVITSLMVAYVRHGLESKWAAWGGVENFLVSWFVHFIGLYLFVAFASIAISMWHKTFLGEEREIIQNRLELQYYIVMAALVAAISILILAHWPAGED
jgi:hypothetical protein